MKTTKKYQNIRAEGSIVAKSIEIIDGFSFPESDGSENQVISTDGDGTLSWKGIESLSITTDGIAEGTNLYFTNERVDDRVSSLIQNGTGISWNYNDLSNTLTPTVSLGSFSTSNLSEGSNLYFTNERVDDRVANLISNGTGISWNYSDIGNSLTPTVSLGSFSTSNLSEGTNLYFTNERVDDRVSALVQDGTGISWNYNDIANRLTPTVSLGSFSTSNLSEGTNLYFTNERVDDRVANLVQDTSSITWSYSDNGAGAGSLSATASALVEIESDGTSIGTRDTLNFIEGAGVNLAIVDDTVNSKIDITINAGEIGDLGTINTVASAGVQIGDSDISILNFLDKFTIVESPNKQINIDIDILLDEVANVHLTSPISDGDVLAYNSDTGIWTNEAQESSGGTTPYVIHRMQAGLSGDAPEHGSGEYQWGWSQGSGSNIGGWHYTGVGSVLEASGYTGWTANLMTVAAHSGISGTGTLRLTGFVTIDNATSNNGNDVELYIAIDKFNSGGSNTSFTEPVTSVNIYDAEITKSISNNRANWMFEIEITSYSILKHELYMVGLAFDDAIEGSIDSTARWSWNWKLEFIPST